MWLCRVFGHRYHPMLTDKFWTALVHRCTRCGAIETDGVKRGFGV